LFSGTLKNILLITFYFFGFKNYLSFLTLQIYKGYNNNQIYFNYICKNKVKKMDKSNLHTQTSYAKLKGVSQPYIAKLVKQRKLIEYYDSEKRKNYIVDCNVNDDVFKNKV